MIDVDEAKCTDCGECIPACTSGALSFRDGHLSVHEGLCRSCGACLQACPQGALYDVSPAVKSAPGTPAAASEVVTVKVEGERSLWWARLLPVASTLAAFATREVLPVVAHKLIARAVPAAGIGLAIGRGVISLGGGRRQRNRQRSGRG